MCDLPTKYVKIWSYCTFACGTGQKLSAIAIETMELLQFCT